MLEAFSGVVGKVLGFLLGPLWKYLSAKFWRPHIKLKKAPKNFLEYLNPSSSQDYVREVLGPAHRVVHSTWFYRFSDALVQIEFWEDGGAKSIALGLVGNQKKHYFPIPFFEKPLGQLYIVDVLQEQSILRFRTSLRHEEVLIETRLGPTGAWNNWTFGAMMAVGSQFLYESYFEWDHEEKRLITEPSSVLVNWVAISSSADEVCFDWSMS